MMQVPFSKDSGRPEFMVTLGLLPPYTLSDVKAAYHARAMEVHPDRGGGKADFLKIHEAYLRATEYVQFIGDRRKWIADQVGCYLRQQEAVAAVERLGGRAEFKEVDWLKPYLGDFASLADRLCAIWLQDTAADDAFLDFLTGKPPRAPYLIELYLANTRITDQGLRALRQWDLLRRLDLSGTRVTNRGVRAAVMMLPALEWIGMAGSGVGWLSRWRLRALLRRRAAERRRFRLLIPSS
jgi:hypothetical protein